MENSAANGTVTSSAVAAEPLTAAVVVKRLQRGAVTLARSDRKRCFAVHALMPEQLAEYDWAADCAERRMELPVSKRRLMRKFQKPAFYHWASRSLQSWLRKDWKGLDTEMSVQLDMSRRGKIHAEGCFQELFQVSSFKYLYFILVAFYSAWIHFYAQWTPVRLCQIHLLLQLDTS